MSQLRRAWLVALCFALAATIAQAQTPEPPAQPVVGQPGKDVVWIPSPLDMVEKMLDMARVERGPLALNPSFRHTPV